MFYPGLFTGSIIYYVVLWLHQYIDASMQTNITKKIFIFETKAPMSKTLSIRHFRDSSMFTRFRSEGLWVLIGYFVIFVLLVIQVLIGYFVIFVLLVFRQFSHSVVKESTLARYYIQSLKSVCISLADRYMFTFASRNCIIDLDAHSLPQWVKPSLG